MCHKSSNSTKRESYIPHTPQIARCPPFIPHHLHERLDLQLSYSQSLCSLRSFNKLTAALVSVEALPAIQPSLDFAFHTTHAFHWPAGYTVFSSMCSTTLHIRSHSLAANALVQCRQTRFIAPRSRPAAIDRYTGWHYMPTDQAAAAAGSQPQSFGILSCVCVSAKKCACTRV